MTQADFPFYELLLIVNSFDFISVAEDALANSALFCIEFQCVQKGLVHQSHY